MLIEGGYLHSLKALVEKARKTPDPTPAAEAAAKEKAPPPRPSSGSHGTVSEATVRNLMTRQ